MTEINWLNTKPVRHGDLWERRGSDDVAVYNPDTGVLALLNPSALAIWELCDGSVTGDEIVGAIGEISNTPLQQAHDQAIQALRSLERLGLITPY